MSNEKSKEKDEQVRIDIIKWIVQSILTPLLPVAVKMLVGFFSTNSVDVIDASELLYYSFFICILIIESMGKQHTVFTTVASYTLIVVSIVDIVLIAIVVVGDASVNVTPFAIAVAIICACIGIIYRVAVKD